jgi:hypothetical protein
LCAATNCLHTYIPALNSQALVNPSRYVKCDCCSATDPAANMTMDDTVCIAEPATKGLRIMHSIFEVMFMSIFVRIYK